MTTDVKYKSTLLIVSIAVVSITIFTYVLNMYVPLHDVVRGRAFMAERGSVVFHAEPLQMRPVPNCSVRLITEERELKRHRPQNSPDCTLTHFRRYVQNNGHFMGEGVWYAPQNGTITMDTDYYPTGCQFSRRLSTAQSLIKCFMKAKVNKIVMSGDSHTNIMFDRLLYYLQEPNGKFRCKPINNSSNSLYFAVPGIGMNFPAEPGTTISRKSRCTMLTNRTIIVERLGMYQMVESSIYVDNTFNKFADRLIHASSRLEYILRYYFPHTGFPDLWIYNVPFQHMTWSSTVQRARGDIEYLFTVLEAYLPPTTTLIFVINNRECGDPNDLEMYQGYEQTFRNFWNVSRNQRLQEMTQMFYEVVLERIDRFPNVYPFLDGVKLSCPVECLWHGDPGHMVMYWYDKMVRYILESFCANS